MYSGIIPIIKQAALDAVNSTQPVNVLFGKVTSVSPLKIQVSPKLVLEAGNLVLAGHLKKTTFTVKMNGVTERIDLHNHGVNLSRTITLDNTLKKNDSVILLRIQGGNTYLVLDKAVDA